MAKIEKLFLLSILTINMLVAQKTDTSLQLPSISIQSNRIQEHFLSSAKSINILSKQQLDALPVQTVQEALQYLAGVRLNSRGFPHVQSDVSIRGGSFDQALILIDGIKMNDAQTGHHLMNIPIPLSQIERIEIIKGPSARIYGPNAYSGVINIITKKSEDENLQIKAYGGNFEAGGINLSANLRSGNLQHQFAVSKDFSGGFRPNTDYQLDNYFYKSTYSYDQHRLQFMSGFTERDFGANGFYADPSFSEQEEMIQTSLMAVQHKWIMTSTTLRTNLYWRRNQDIYIFDRTDPDLYRNVHIGNNLGIESHLNWVHPIGSLGVGIDLRRESLRSNNLGDRDRNTIALAVEERLSFFDQKLHLTPGIFINYYSDHGINFLPGVDANYQLNENFSLSAAIGNTLRVPTYTDLYYKDPVNIGNPDLEAERALTHETSLKYARNNIEFQLAYFNRNNQSLIDWRKEGNTWRATNIDSVKFRGIESHLKLKDIFTWNQLSLSQLNLQYAYLVGEYFENESLQSRYTFDHQNHRWVAQAVFQLPASIQFSSSIRYAVPYDQGLEEYFILDFSVSYKKEQFGIFVEAINLTNTSYFGANGLPMPGRWVRAGVEFSFLSKS